ncbi:MAG: endonuclease/exonuclease/phosphatase family protein [Bacteroidales bacterium]|nr:endonuclease/exonuclease/phosphatase family protein [Bacteroidales bacterium]
MRYLKRSLCLFLVCFLAYSGLDAQDIAENDSSGYLKVLTFNIFHGEIYSPEEGQTAANNLGIVSDIINSLKPDLVALQEVDCRTFRSSGVDLLTELALSTKMYSLYGRAMKFDGGEYGLGILSRYSFSSTNVRPLFSPSGSEPRIALESKVVLDTGDTIRFVCTHLDHSRDSSIRNNQAKDLIKYFENDNFTTILAGDLNARPGNKPIEILTKKWIDSGQEKTPEAGSFEAERRIDYILFSPQPLWRLIENKIIYGRGASDHNPVLSVFEIHKK